MTLSLQVCQACGAVQYPRRAVCGSCLSGDLPIEDTPGEGTVLSWTVGHVSALPAFKDKTPLYIARIKLRSGARVVAFADQRVASGLAVDVTRNEGTGALEAKPL